MGKRIEENPVGSLASVSFRIAEPGFGDQLEAEIKRIFEELSVIEGYRGTFTFRNEALDEEVVGIVFWLTTRAFEASLPHRNPYEVKLYRRTA
jgi:heme-degrading monooxygenase HmoA